MHNDNEATHDEAKLLWRRNVMDSYNLRDCFSTAIRDSIG